MSADGRHQHFIHKHAGHHGHGGAADPGFDPVCGVPVDPEMTAPRGPLHDGPAPPPPHGAIYACPMHPKVRQAGPGVCPICNLPLEPLMSAAGGSAAVPD